MTPMDCELVASALEGALISAENRPDMLPAEVIRELIHDLADLFSNEVQGFQRGWFLEQSGILDEGS